MDRRPLLRASAPPLRRSRLATLVLLLGGLILLLLSLAPLAGAAPRKIIFDPLATPSRTSWIAGSGAGWDEANSVLALPGDTVLVAGGIVNGAGNSDLSLTKYVGGTLKWTRTWDGPSHLDDMASDMALSPNGKDVYIAGLTSRPGGNVQIAVVKLSVKNGALRWARRRSAPGSEVNLPTDMTVDTSGNVTVVGYAISAAVLPDAVVMSWTPSGDKRWLWRYDGPAHATDYGAAIEPGPSGSVYLTGAASLAVAVQGALTARLSSTGKKVWLRTYAGPEGIGAGCHGAALRPGGGVYVCGTATRAATGQDGMILRYSPKGARQVIALDDGGGGASLQGFGAVAVASTKAVIGAGSSGAGGNQDPHVAAYRADGAPIGAWTFPSAWDDTFIALTTDDFGGFYATGTFMTGPAASTIATLRGSVRTGGGGFASSWAQVASTDNSPYDIAVRGTTVHVVGIAASGGAGGVDQVVLTYIW